MELTPLRLADLVCDAGTQIRLAISDTVVDEYAEQMRDGVVFPPPVVFKDGTRYLLADGFHRVAAVQRNGGDHVRVRLIVGTLIDAIWFALGAHRTHGQRWTLADVKHAIRVAVQTWPDRSQKEIARHLGCSPVYVTRVRAEMTQTDVLPDRVQGKDGKSYPATHTQTKDPAKETAMRDDIGKRVREGESTRSIAAALHVRPSTVASVRREVQGTRDQSHAAVTERRRTVHEMAGQGATLDRIADATGLSVKRIAEIFHQDGLGSRARSESGHDRTKSGVAERLDLLRQLAKQGVTSQEIAKRIGLSHERVCDIAKREGLVLAREGHDKTQRAVAKRTETIRDMAGRGFTTRQIAERVGLGRSQVTILAKREGIEIRADAVVGPTRHHDPNRIIERMAITAVHLCADVDLIDFSRVDAARYPEWLQSFSEAREQLGAFIRRLREERQRTVEEGETHAASA